MGAIAGDINTNPMRCATVADLASRPVGSKETGDLAYVETLVDAPSGPFFFFKRGSDIPAAPGVVNALGGGQWLSLAQYGSVSSGPFDFVYRPGDPAPVAGVYNDWATLIAAAFQFPGDKEVFFQDDLAPIVIPAGVWDFGPGLTTWTGTIREVDTSTGPPGTTLVTMQDGAFIRGVRRYENVHVRTLNSSPTPVFNASDDSDPLGATIFSLRLLARIEAAGAGPAIGTTTNLQFFAIALFDGTLLTSTGAGAALSISGAATSCVIACLDAAAITDNCIASPSVGIFAQAISAAVQVSVNQVGLTGLGGILPIQLAVNSNLVIYNDTAPVLGAQNVQAAIDILKWRGRPTGLTNGGAVAINPADTVIVTVTGITVGRNGSFDIDAVIDLLNTNPQTKNVVFAVQAQVDGGGFTDITPRFDQHIGPNNAMNEAMTPLIAQFAALAGQTIDFRVVANTPDPNVSSTVSSLRYRFFSN